MDPQNHQNRNGRGYEGFEGGLTLPRTNFLAHWDNEDWQAAFDERAAILEFDERLPRPEAEHRARIEIEQQRRRKWH
jgi:hypothetical protein